MTFPTVAIEENLNPAKSDPPLSRSFRFARNADLGADRQPLEIRDRLHQLLPNEFTHLSSPDMSFL